MSAQVAATQVCTKCGVAKPLDCYNVRHARGQLYRQCRDCMASRKWAAKHPERHLAFQQQWVAKNRDRARAIWRDMAARRRKDPSYRLENRIRCGIYAFLSGQKKTVGTFELVGYSVDELRSHLERQFTKGMSWGNMGDWHIDHIIPLASFTITGPDDPELRRAWALPNLRPLWAADNIAKRDKRVTLL